MELDSINGFIIGIEWLNKYRYRKVEQVSVSNGEISFRIELWNYYRYRMVELVSVSNGRISIGIEWWI